MVEKPTVGGFVIWLLLGLVTGGIYTSWWIFSRLEVVYRAAASSRNNGFRLSSSKPQHERQVEQGRSQRDQAPVLVWLH